MNLTFDFMERTKSIPFTEYNTSKIYTIKSLLVLCWILSSQILTSFLYLPEFIVYITFGMTLLVGISSEKRPFYKKQVQVFFLLVLYNFFPFYTHFYTYILASIILVVIMEVFFIHFNGFFINPIYLTILFFLVCFPSVFKGYQSVFILNYTSVPIFYWMYSIPIMEDSIVYKELVTALLGIYGSYPSISLGVLGLLLYFFPFVPKIITRSSFMYLVSIIVTAYFIVFYMYLVNKLPDNFTILSYAIHLFNQMGIYAPIFFIAFFIIPETLGTIQNFKFPVIMAIFSGFFTALIFIMGEYALAPVLGCILSYNLMYCLVEFLKPMISRNQ